MFSEEVNKKMGKKLYGMDLDGVDGLINGTEDLVTYYPDRTERRKAKGWERAFMKKIKKQLEDAVDKGLL